MATPASARDTHERRSDPPLAEPFSKDPSAEQFLQRLNSVLAPHAETDYEDLDEEFPTLHVVGVPRSGTTLLYQAVAHGLDMGYVNNLVAAFWRAPVYGLRLAQKLGVAQADSSFDSTFGRTDGIAEPHEFGYFWNAHLRYPDLCERPPGHESTIDWPGLRRVIVNMALAVGKPMAFKPMLLIWHLEAAVRSMPRTCFVWIRRDPRETALSLLRMRMSLFGTYERWASLRPGGPTWLDDEPPARQVAAQVLMLERTLEQAAAQLGPERVLTVGYEEFCADPAGVLAQTRDLLGAHGRVPAWRGTSLPPFEPRVDEDLTAEFGSQVEDALEEFSELGS